MRQILRSDWLPERARLSDTACFDPANKISPKFKRVHESFLSPMKQTTEINVTG